MARIQTLGLPTGPLPRVAGADGGLSHAGEPSLIEMGTTGTGIFGRGYIRELGEYNPDFSGGPFTAYRTFEQMRRGDAQVAQAQLDTKQAQLSDMNAQVDADVRDALLDIASAQKQVEVARSSVELAGEALSEAQQRYANGVSDNLAVSQAEQSVAQANDQYVASLYRHNVAKLSLARALGAGENYKIYLGGK